MIDGNENEAETEKYIATIRQKKSIHGPKYTNYKIVSQYNYGYMY